MTDSPANQDVAPVAMVTGGAKRVGRAIAIALADSGFDVAIHYRESYTEAAETKSIIEPKGRRCIIVQGDLIDSNLPTKLVSAVEDAFGRLDVLINNASVFERDSTDGFSSEHWHKMMQVNAIAPAALIEAVTHLLEKSPCGHIVNLCDISADRPWPDHRAYCASKAALANLTLSYARKLAPQVCVNGVAPGIAVFPDEYDESTRKQLTAKVPLKREGTVDDIAEAVKFLVVQGDYITGQIIRVDGGRSIV